MSIAGQGVDKEQFEEVVGVLAERAFEDQCTTANPKLPLISELKEIYMEAYKGDTIKRAAVKLFYWKTSPRMPVFTGLSVS